MAENYKIVEPEYPYFITCTVVGWLPVFTRPEAVEIVLDSWRYLRREENLRLLGYVILENHLHLIAQAEKLKECIDRFKGYTAHRLVQLLKSCGARTILRQLQRETRRPRTDRDYQFWIEGFHPKQMRTEMMLRQKLEYIHMNPVKRGYVDDPVHWRYSSARIYAKQPGLIEIDTDW